MTQNNADAKGQGADAHTTLFGAIPQDCAAVLVYATFPSLSAAEETGRKLVNGKLAGCINILPAMISIYTWQGAVERAEEVVLLAKTRPSLAEACSDQIVQDHPYETPAVLVMPVAAGSRSYLEWLWSGTEH